MSLKKINKENYENKLEYLYFPDANEEEKVEIKRFLDECIIKYGDVVESYPYWHPLVTNQVDPRTPTRTPNERCGYKGLDHNVYLKNAFITCPYGLDMVEEIKNSVLMFKESPIAKIKVIELLNKKLYARNTFPVLVVCDWYEDVLMRFKLAGNSDLISLPLILEKQMENWVEDEVSESWESMEPYYLGTPVEKEGSPFVSASTVKEIKKVHEILDKIGMHGRSIK